ncbi:unnamed protein product [Rotaria sp. Silwood2]|nr:unnamed protein product [Rotaria sp. Silwood2]
MLYEFNQGSTAAEATRIVTGTHGAKVVDSSACRRWFAKLRSGDISVTDKPRSERPMDFDDEALETLPHADPRQTTRELAAQLNCSHITVDHHLRALGKIHKYEKWVP